MNLRQKMTHKPNELVRPQTPIGDVAAPLELQNSKGIEKICAKEANTSSSKQEAVASQWDKKAQTSQCDKKAQAFPDDKEAQVFQNDKKAQAFPAAKPPLRTCVICRRKLPKIELRRHTLTSQGYTLDLKQRAEGRGVYICHEELCLERFKKYRQTGRKQRKGIAKT